MRISALFAGLGLSAALMGCQSVPEASSARLTQAPNTEQMLAIKTAVKTAMKRDDLDMDPGKLVESSILLVRPMAVSGLTDRVPGTPKRFTLMRSAEGCYLLEEGAGMRINLPDMPCQ